MGREGERGVARVELRVLAALVQETAPLPQRTLVEVEAGCDVGDVEDRVAERASPATLVLEPRNLRETNACSIRIRLYTRYLL